MARILGLDIGSHSVKGVVLESSMRAYLVRTFIEVPLSRGGEGHLAQTSALRELMQQLGPPVDQVVLALPGTHLATHAVSLPFADPKRIEAALPFELESQIPFELTEAAYDYQPTSADGGGGGGEAKPAELIVGVVRKAELTSLLTRLTEVGIEPAVITHPGLALQNVLLSHAEHFTTGLKENGRVAIVDIGRERTSVAIGRPGLGVDWVRTFTGGGDDLSRTLATEFRTAFEDAEAWKLAHGAVGPHADGAEGERARAALLRGLQPIVRELRATMKSWSLRSRAEVARVVLCGGTARLPGIADELAGLLGVEVQTLALPLAAQETIPVEQQTTAALAYCLALRGQLSGARAPRFNFRRGELAFKGGLDFVKERLPKLAGYAAVLLVLLIGSSAIRNSMLAQRESRVDAMLCTETERVLGTCEKNFDRALSMMKGKESATAALPEHSAAELLAMLTRKIPAEVPVKMDQIVVDLDRISLRGETETATQIDKLQTALKGSACFREIKTGKVEKAKDGKHVSFRLDIQVDCSTALASNEGTTK